jgi:CheY-like chemotaxis protein
MARIVVVDDEPGIRVFLRLVLESGGHQVSEASAAAAGLALLARERPEVLVCDLMMPDVDGLTVIREARRMTPGLGIVAVSGCPALIDRLLSQPLPGDGMLRTVLKPCTPVELLTAVREVNGR